MKKIVLFDGFCNLCSRSVQFIIRHDKLGYFKFAALSSTIGQSLLMEQKIDSKKLDSIVYLRNGSALIKSTAVLYILKDLRGGWGLLFGFIVIPRVIRDFFYDLIAKSRYKLLGKRDSCMVPDERIKDRFLGN